MQLITTQDIQTYIDKVQLETTTKFQKQFSSLTPHTYSFTIGKKYIKILEHTYDSPIHTCVFCFIDKTGGLYKAAGTSPAKGIRGSIFDETPPVKLGDFYIKSK